MQDYKKCLNCGSEKLEHGKVNTHFSINGLEERHIGIISQKCYQPTDAFICKGCGYIALFVDWSKTPWKEE